MADPLPQIRDQVLSILKAGQVLGGAYGDDHYFVDYPPPFPETARPLLSVTIESDDLGWPGAPESASLASGAQRRTLTISIFIATAYYRERTDPVGGLHTFRRSVLRELAQDRGLGNQIPGMQHVEYLSTEWEIQSEGELPTATADIKFQAYYTDDPSAD